MPLRIPSDLYSGGQVSFNTTPFTNTVLKDIAEKKAAKAAIIKNADVLRNKLNVAGVRNQDRVDPTNPNQGIDIDIANWYSNAKAGKIDMNLYNDILNKVELSKNRAKLEGDVGKLVQDNKMDVDEDDVHAVSKIGLSIYNPESKKEDGSEYGLIDLPANTPVWNTNDQSSFFKTTAANAKPNTQIGKPTVSGNQYIYKFGYSDDAIREAADNAIALSAGNNVIAKHSKKLLTKNNDGTFSLKPQFAYLNNAYQSIYGKDQVVDDPTKALKAFTIDNLKRVVETKTSKIPAPRVYRGRGGGGSSSTGTPRDIWTPVNDLLEINISKGKTQTDLLDAEAAFTADAVKDIIERAKSVDKYLYPEDLTLRKSGNTISVYDKTSGRYLFNWDRESANIGKTPGVKGKEINIKIGNPNKGETKTTGKKKFD